MKKPAWLVKELKEIGLGKLKFNLEWTNKFVSEYDEDTNTVYISKFTGSWADKTTKKINNRPTNPKHTYRHEVGHAFFNSIKRFAKSERFKRVFGDVNDDYNGTKDLIKSRFWKEIPDEYVSNYAQAHPWEDFAETFAEYMEFGIYEEDPYWIEEKKNYIFNLIEKYG